MDRESSQSPADQQRNWIHAGRLVRDVTHDVNNYLGAILAYAELFALDNESPGELGDTLEEITLCVKNSSSLLDTLASVVGRDLTTPESVDLVSLVHDAMSLFKREFDRSEIRVTIKLPDQPCTIDGVRTRLVRLLVHAIRFETDALAASPPPRELAVKLAGAGDAYALRIGGSARHPAGSLDPVLAEAEGHATYHRGSLVAGPTGFVITLPRKTDLA